MKQQQNTLCISALKHCYILLMVTSQAVSPIKMAIPPDALNPDNIIPHALTLTFPIHDITPNLKLIISWIEFICD